MYEETKSPDEEPQGVAPSPAVDAPSAAAPTGEGESDVIRIPDDHNPAGLKEAGDMSGTAQSTLESWMAAAEKAEKRKITSTGQRLWYILKVQSNREDSIRDALKRKIAIEGLGDFFGDIIVPIEKVTEFKNGKKRVVKRKLYPGYIVVNMELNDDTWYLVRGTGGIGDFTGSGGKPNPMSPADVKKILQTQEEKKEEPEKFTFKYKKGDKVKINEGMFENYEGEVESLDTSNGRVTVVINIFGRPVPVELDHWQLESL